MPFHKSFSGMVIASGMDGIGCTDAALQELVAAWHMLSPAVRETTMELARGKDSSR